MPLSPDLADLKSRCQKALQWKASLARVEQHLGKLGGLPVPAGVSPEAHLLAVLAEVEAGRMPVAPKAPEPKAEKKPEPKPEPKKVEKKVEPKKPEPKVEEPAPALGVEPKAEGDKPLAVPLLPGRDQGRTGLRAHDAIRLQPRKTLESTDGVGRFGPHLPVYPRWPEVVPLGE